MDPLFLILISSFLPPSLHALNLASRITVVGAVFCDVCYNNAFSSHSFLLPGVDVNVECKFKEKSRGTREQMNVSVNTSTDRFGVYRLEIANADGVECIRSDTLCRATLLKSSRHHSFCNIGGVSTTSSDIIAFKSRQNNKNHHCIYSLSALSYRPVKRNTSLCASNNKISSDPRQYNSSKFFLIPPYGFFWPPYLPHLPPLPQLPNLPFPFPPTPPLFSPPVFNLGDPRGWFPNLPPPPPPFVPPPPPPSSSFDLGNPRTWIPLNPPTPPPS